MGAFNACSMAIGILELSRLLPLVRVKLCTLFGKSAQELGLLEEPSPSAPAEGEASEAGPPNTTLPKEPVQQSLSSRPQDEPPWNVPFARNPFFTGRSRLLERLHEEERKAYP